MIGRLPAPLSGLREVEVSLHRTGAHRARRWFDNIEEQTAVLWHHDHDIFALLSGSQLQVPLQSVNRIFLGIKVVRDGPSIGRQPLRCRKRCQRDLPAFEFATQHAARRVVKGLTMQRGIEPLTLGGRRSVRILPRIK